MEKKKRIEWLDIDQDWKDLIWDINERFMEGLAVLTISALMGLLSFSLLAQPDGIAGVLGRMMAKTCVETGYCDYWTLLGAVGLAMVLLTSFTVYTMMVIRKEERNMGEDDSAKDQEIYEKYKGKQLEVLEEIRGLKVVDSLSGYNAYKGLNYSTLYRWVQQFEKDGYVQIEGNGAGSPLKVKAL